MEQLELPKNYNSKEIEKKWQDIWESSGIFKWNQNISRADSFVIDTPPPTVSGLLHMGHIFSYTQADFIARFQRMIGKNVFYPIGFDDNGLPTERLVEKVKKIRANSLPREEFTSICREVVVEAEEEFRKVFKSIALSVDWSQEYQTISDKSIALSQMSFLDLIKKDRAYRKIQPTLWDPVDATALAQAEVVDVEMSSYLNDIIFKSESGEDLIIATSRPELLAACVALFFNPTDNRYKHLNGKYAISPLFNVKVPILSDEKVEIEKGTGLVMCCTFGDTTDIDWWKSYDLPVRVILNKFGKIDVEKADWLDNSSEYCTAIQNLKAKDARDKVIELLKHKNLLVKQNEITHVVKCAERSGAPLEILVTSQWFIKLLDIKEELLDQVKKCDWHPKYMQVRLEHWIEGLKWDWCISRQRFFGVPFPVWYSKRKGEEGKLILASKEDLPVNPLTYVPKGYLKEEVEPDFDVMDTWATSSISPQLNSQSINEEFAFDLERHQKLFPADLRPQAHEIIRTWAFYTLVKSYLHQQEIPWKNLMISGWCLAADKTKMSKSKGNVVTPVDLIEEKGADIIRYWASHSKLGADIAYSEEVFKLGNKLINKIWNAAKFAQLQLKNLKYMPTSIKSDVQNGKVYKPVDLWLLSKLKITVEKSTEEFCGFEYSNARVIIEDFFWNIFCDNYIEIVKTRAYGENLENPDDQASALITIYHCFNVLLRLFAPFTPHVVEEINSYLFANSKIKINEKNTWPKLDDFIFDSESISIGDALVDIVDSIRKIKANKQLSVSAPIKNLSIKSVKRKVDITKAFDDLQNVTKSCKISLDDILTAQEAVEESYIIDCEFESI